MLINKYANIYVIFRTLHLWYSYTLQIHQHQEFNVTVQSEDKIHATVKPVEDEDQIVDDRDQQKSTRINKLFRLTLGKSNPPSGRFELRLTITDKKAGMIYRTKFWPPSMNPMKQMLPSKWSSLHRTHLEWTLCQEKYHLRPRFICPCSKRKLWASKIALAQKPVSIRRRYSIKFRVATG